MRMLKIRVVMASSRFLPKGKVNAVNVLIEREGVVNPVRVEAITLAPRPP
jgi:hypothetical protein